MQPTIENTKPNTDCVYCEIYNYVESDGKTPSKDKYAVCVNRKKTGGCQHIDIALKGNPLLFQVSCKNCKEYKSRSQLELFND